MAGNSGIFGASGGRPLETGQATVYHIGDDASYRKGLAKAYAPAYTTGVYSGTSNVDVPAYAAATISFDAASKEVRDSAGGMAPFKTGDTMRIRGSAGNDAILTVATGNVAAKAVVTEAIADEAAGAYITICKRVVPSNNAVYDRRTKKMWRRYATVAAAAELCGPASDGKLVWYDATLAYTLHPAAADLQMISASRTLRIVGGAGEVARYNPGYVIVCAGFANAGNNAIGHVIVSVTVNGADLDIVLKSFLLKDGTESATLTDEAAAGARSISIICQNIYAYCAAMNVAALAGYSDWRIPNKVELGSIQDNEAPTGVPDGTAFPNWPASNVWSSSIIPAGTTLATPIGFAGDMGQAAKDTAYVAAFVRG